MPVHAAAVAVVLTGAMLLLAELIIHVSSTPHIPTLTDIVHDLRMVPGMNATLYLKRSSLCTRGRNFASIYITNATRNATGPPDVWFNAVVAIGPESDVETYSLVDGRAYYSISHNGTVLDVQCLPADQVPPLSLLMTSLASATQVHDVFDSSYSWVHCDSTLDRIFQLQFAGEPYLVCISSTTNQLRAVIGQDIEMDVAYIANATDAPPISIPQVPHSNTPLACPDIRNAIVSVNQPSNLPFDSYMALPATTTQTTCTCQGEAKPCLFVHGLGEQDVLNLSTTFPSYWGNIQDHAPCCTTTHFAHLDMVNQGWTNDLLQQSFCDAVLAVSGGDNRTIGNLILVAHSMGNLVAAAAVAAGKCHMVQGNITWVSLGGPMLGTPSANLIVELCQNELFSAISNAAQAFLGSCPAKAGRMSLLVESPNDPARAAQYAQAQHVWTQFVTRAACGTSPVGLYTSYSPLLLSTAKLASLTPANDGLVPWVSCTAAALDPSAFDTTYTSPFYKAAVNHVDLTFRNSDGWWGADRKPIKWFECGL
ncbi:Aste57867_20179 [Aphanomyces stellatus]|uniref:Aste57867_20179 protein n=1 Tax=Aphanomyces stellatus TaxID=120398 RepID=A0A485LFL3_9STRA|nr:hypothetical protein As57867_020113 [Aphanomyces stellatus]VFT96873.1 Aste57867_20179 [Aphanomyces stellatus]